LFNYVELFDEFTIMMVTPHMLCYTEFLPDMQTRYYVGWSHIYWMC